MIWQEGTAGHHLLLVNTLHNVPCGRKQSVLEHTPENRSEISKLTLGRFNVVTKYFYYRALGEYFEYFSEQVAHGHGHGLRELSFILGIQILF